MLKAHVAAQLPELLHPVLGVQDAPVRRWHHNPVNLHEARETPTETESHQESSAHGQTLKATST